MVPRAAVGLRRPAQRTRIEAQGTPSFVSSEVARTERLNGTASTLVENRPKLSRRPLDLSHSAAILRHYRGGSEGAQDPEQGNGRCAKEEDPNAVGRPSDDRTGQARWRAPLPASARGGWRALCLPAPGRPSRAPRLPADGHGDRVAKGSGCKGAGLVHRPKRRLIAALGAAMKKASRDMRRLAFPETGGRGWD